MYLSPWFYSLHPWLDEDLVNSLVVPLGVPKLGSYVKIFHLSIRSCVMSKGNYWYDM